jgi:hypothetical protein
MECALGDPWEDCNHGVSPVLLVQVGEPEHVGTVVEESTTQKAVHEKDISNHVEKVHELQLHILDYHSESVNWQSRREKKRLQERGASWDVSVNLVPLGHVRTGWCQLLDNDGRESKCRESA